MSDPLALIHKALDLLSAHQQIEQLYSALSTRNREQTQEADALRTRRLELEAAAAAAAGKRLERLREAVACAEAQLQQENSHLERADAALADARSGVKRLLMFANEATSRVGGGSSHTFLDPMACNGEELAGIARRAIEVLSNALRLARSPNTEVQVTGDKVNLPLSIPGSQSMMLGTFA